MQHRLSKIIQTKLQSRFGTDSVFFSKDGNVIEAYFTKEGRNHTAAGENDAVKAATLNRFREIVDNSEYVYSAMHDVHSNAGSRVNENTVWDYFAAVVQYGEFTQPIKISLRDIENDAREQVYNVAAKKEDAATHDRGSENTNAWSNYGASTSSEDNITEPTAEVKQKYQRRKEAVVTTEKYNASQGMKNTAPESGVKYMSYETAKEDGFDTLIGRYYSDNLRRTDPIYVGTAAKDAADLISSDAPLIISKADMDKSVRVTGKNAHYSAHGMNRKFIETLPERISSAPFAYTEDRNGVESFTYVVFDEFTGKLTAIGGELNAEYEGRTVNRIRSIYDIDSPELFLTKESKSLVTKNKKAAEEILRRSRIKTSGLQEILDRMATITDAEETVKENTPEIVEETISQYQQWDEETQNNINTSMTMDQARTMIQKTFKYADPNAEKDEGETRYRNGDEWLRDVGAREVAMYIENEYELQDKYVNSNEHIINDEFTIEDVVQAYLGGTLIGKAKPKPERLDTSRGTGFDDSRFYAPKNISVSQETMDLASSKATAKTKAEVNEARKNILLAAHNGNLAEELGITQSELNKKLRSWSRYPASARETSMRINAGAAPENQWTGIQNTSILSQISMTDEDIRSMVKGITGTSSEYQRNYIGRTMLALDTHINWSNLTFEFLSGNVDPNRSSVRGRYRNENKTIYIGRGSGENTVAHEMGHALDYQWEIDLFGKSYGESLTGNKLRTDLIKTDEGRQFYKNFRIFMDSLTDVGSNYSSYTMDPGETFARFVAKFVEWTRQTAGEPVYREYLSYDDRFTTSQYIEFARLLQEKAMIDGREASGSVQYMAWDAEEFGSEVQKWLDTTTPENRLKSPGYFTVGTTSDVLKSIGVKDGDVFWGKSKIQRILNDHGNEGMTPDLIKQVPSLLEDPILVMKSRTQESSIVVLGDLQTADGKPVLASVILTPSANVSTALDFSIISGSHPRKINNARNLVENSEILFIDSNKKRTESWLKQLGVQFPSRQPVLGSVGKITYSGENVNITGKKFSELFSESTEESNTQNQQWETGEEDTAEESRRRAEANSRIEAENRILEQTVSELNTAIAQQKVEAEKEIAKLGGKVSDLQRELSLTAENEVRQKDAERIARNLLREYSGTADKAEIAADIKALGDYIVQNTGETLDYQEIRGMATEIAEKIAESASAVLPDESGERKTYQEIADFIKGVKLYIPVQDRGELDISGGYNEFRKSNFGRFTLGEGGRDIDGYYTNDLQATFGRGYFPDVNSQGEQLMIIADMFERAKPEIGNPYADYMGETVNNIANDIIFDTLSENLRQMPATFADRAKAKYDALRADKNARIEQVRKEGLARKEEALAREKAEKWDKVQGLKDYYRNREREAHAKRKESSGFEASYDHRCQSLPFQR